MRWPGINPNIIRGVVSLAERWLGAGKTVLVIEAIVRSHLMGTTPAPGSPRAKTWHPASRIAIMVVRSFGQESFGKRQLEVSNK